VKDGRRRLYRVDGPALRPVLAGVEAEGVVAAVVPSGFLGLNPALVTVAVARSAVGSRVRVDAYALEGLVRQRAALKAARRVADLLAAPAG
jgi:hypothetical protein